MGDHGWKRGPFVGRYSLTRAADFMRDIFGRTLRLWGVVIAIPGTHHGLVIGWMHSRVERADTQDAGGGK